MTIKDLIAELNNKKIKIDFSGGKLKYTGPEEHITPELIDKLKRFKGKLIKYYWPKDFNNFMPIQPEGNKIPLFLVHGDVGNYSLSDNLGKDRPVFGFFHLGSNGERIPFKKVSDMAKSYLDKVRALYPDGPYYLAGFSFGGILAYEMAIQLIRDGYKVPFLALIDSYSPLAREPRKRERNVFRFLRINILRPIKLSVINKLTCFYYDYFFIRKKPLPEQKRKTYIWYKYERLGIKYNPDKFNGTLLLFKTVENFSSHKYLGWDKLVDNIELFHVEGKHTEIFWNKKSVDTISNEFKRQIDLLDVKN